MGGKSKLGTRRQVNFTDGIKLLSESMDQKFLDHTGKFTQLMSSFKLRLEVLEDLLIDKLGITEDVLKDRLLVRVEKNQGFQEVSTPVERNSIVRIKVKEEVVGQESSDNPLVDSFMVVGHNQINSNIDVLLIGALAGETREVTVPNPKNPEELRKLTVVVCKVFQGQGIPEGMQPTDTTGAEPSDDAATLKEPEGQADLTAELKEPEVSVQG